MPQDPMYDAALLNLAEVQNTMRRLLAAYHLEVKAGQLRGDVFYLSALHNSINGLETDIMKKLHGE